MRMLRRNYTILELLFVISCIIILLSMLLPAFNESREKTRFVRWIGFNKQCSDDPSCVINFNFQEGQGSILANSAAGHENNKFNVKDGCADEIMSNKRGGSHFFIHSDKREFSVCRAS